MIPETGASVAPRTPNPQPIPGLEVIVSPKPGKAFSHFGGFAVEGSKVTYSDLNAVMWYLTGARPTFNRGRRPFTRTGHGAGNTEGRRKQ